MVHHEEFEEAISPTPSKKKSKRKKQTPSSAKTDSSIILREKELEDVFGESGEEQSDGNRFKIDPSKVQPVGSLLSPTTQSTCSTLCNDSSRKKKKKKKNKGKPLDDSKEESKETTASIKALIEKNRVSPPISNSLFSWRESHTSPEEVKIELS